MSKPTMPSAFTIALKATDASSFDHTFDVFTILGDGVPLFDIEFGWANDTAKVYCLTEMRPESLPLIVDSFDLIGEVHGALIGMMDEQELFVDLFYDEEGCRIERPFGFQK